MSNDPLGATLLVLARNAICRRLGLPTAPEPSPPPSELERPGAVFVTLTRIGDLRGCIGSLEAHRPLRDDVEDNAISAALRDPRFPPVDKAEFAHVRVEVSLLTPPEPFPVKDEADACARLKPFEDGLVFQVGHQRATFLPQVWEQLPRPRQFLAHLKIKAGLPGDFWSAEVRLSRYQVRKWQEEDRP